MTRQVAAICIALALVTLAFASDAGTFSGVVEELRGIRLNIAALVSSEAQKEIDPTTETFTETELTGATPSVTGKSVFKFVDSTATTVTGFTGGKLGQVITIRATNSNTTLDGGLTKTGMTIPLILGDTLQFQYNGTGWLQVGGSVGMGVYRTIDPGNTLANWPAASVTAFADVLVSSDGVRVGSSAIHCRCRVLTSSVTSAVKVRVDGSSDATNATSVITIDTSRNGHGSFIVGLDNDAEFEAAFSVDWSASDTENSAWVVGYWI